MNMRVVCEGVRPK